ncbi:hypothetical protein GEMRC1_002629 [Eukaryota sp. GEM-RC1]
MADSDDDTDNDVDEAPTKKLPTLSPSSCSSSTVESSDSDSDGSPVAPSISFYASVNLTSPSTQLQIPNTEFTESFFVFLQFLAFVLKYPDELEALSPNSLQYLESHTRRVQIEAKTIASSASSNSWNRVFVDHTQSRPYITIRQTSYNPLNVCSACNRPLISENQYRVVLSGPCVWKDEISDKSYLSWYSNCHELLERGFEEDLSFSLGETCVYRLLNQHQLYHFIFTAANKIDKMSLKFAEIVDGFAPETCRFGSSLLNQFEKLKSRVNPHRKRSTHLLKRGFSFSNAPVEVYTDSE